MPVMRSPATSVVVLRWPCRHTHYGSKLKPQLIWLYVTSNIIWSKPDIERARDAGIYIVTENELNYFEMFVKHMGPAGRYQMLSEFLKGHDG